MGLHTYEHWRRHWFFRLCFHVSHYIFQMLSDQRTHQGRSLFCVLGTLFQLTDKNLNSLKTIRQRSTRRLLRCQPHTEQAQIQKFIYFQFWQSSLKNLLHVLIFAKLKSRCNASKKNWYLFHICAHFWKYTHIELIAFIESWTIIKSVIS